MTAASALVSPDGPASGWLPGWVHGWRREALLVVWLLGFGLVTRWAVLGDLAYFNDESFYLLAGQKLREGLLPYVDVWDRKGPVLFAIYGLLAVPGWGVWPYQIAAWLFASATAWVIAQIGTRVAGAQGGLLAATLYLASLPLFGGAGGQSPVFYNLFVASAAWLVLRACERGVPEPALVLAAMALAGLAIAVKQTAMFEGAFLGGFVVWRLVRGGVPLAEVARRAAMMVLAGAAPLVLAGVVYAAIGHIGAFWHAMVTSNLAKRYDTFGDHWTRLEALAWPGLPLLAGAGLGLVWPAPRTGWDPRPLLLGWLVAAFVGFAVLGNFYDHYALPLLVVLPICAARVFDRQVWGLMAGMAAVWFCIVVSGELDAAPRRAASMTVRAIAEDIRARDAAPRLLVFQGPMALYSLVGQSPPSPLLDNFHLSFPAEANTSPYDTAGEMRRILAWRPSVVVVAHRPDPASENPETARQVRAYLGRCRLWYTRDFAEHVQTTPVDVYGDCK